VEEGGGTVVGLREPADGLVWLSASDMDGLAEALSRQPAIRWVQLPFAGVEKAVERRLIDDSRAWTCAKGSYARPVAEHALMLALAGLRVLPSRIRATSWGTPEGRMMYDAKVTILGGGGITEELLRLLAPFGVDATVVRRQAPAPVPGATRVVGPSDLASVLPGSLVVFLALALTPETKGVIGAAEMDLIGPDGWLVNVARGAHVDTAALVRALAEGRLGGAALDVTDPEPLPDGHPLWSEPRCIITPHTADTWEMVLPPLAERIRTNVARFEAGEPFVGVVDPHAGY
jgi:phosphoglycerate dehydrogenase-like enzyme